MNKSHISDEQVRAAREQIGRVSGSFLSNAQIRDVLEDAFPEPSIQELLRDEERSARHDDTHQPAAFGKLVVSEDDAEEINYAKDIREALQSFVDRHSIKPIALSESKPTSGQEVYLWDAVAKFWHCTEIDDGPWLDDYTHWLPASALPIPELVAVDPKEVAWLEFVEALGCETGLSERALFRAGYEAGQAGGAK